MRGKTVMSDNKDIVNMLYEECEPFIRKICLYKLQSIPDKVDDCVQETFTVLIEALENGQTIKNPKAWLTSVVNNKIKKIYEANEREKKRTAALDRESNDSYCIDNNIPAISETKLLQYKDQIIMQFSDSEQELIYDKYELKKSIRAIAIERNMTENNIYQMISRTKKKAKRLIDQVLPK